MDIKRAAAIVFVSVLFMANGAFALTSRDLIKLKEAGVPEDVIALMLGNGYENADEVISLQKAGFAAGTIKAFILSNKNIKGKKEIDYSTKGLEDRPPCLENPYAPYHRRDSLPGIKLFVIPGITGKVFHE